MTFHDYYLCAADEATLTAALYDEEGNPLVEGDIDVIGTIYEQTGVDGEGEPIMAAIAGYHANLRRREPLADGELDGLLIPTPSTPSCVWFGS